MSDHHKSTFPTDKLENEDLHDPTISRLLTHLKKVREAVPVNYQLKEELKKKLLAQMMQMQKGSAEESPAGIKQARNLLWWLGLPALLLIAWFGFASDDSVAIYDVKELNLMGPLEIVDADISPDGNQLLVLTHDKLYQYSTEGEKQHVYTLQEGNGHFTHLSWSPLGDQVALIQNEQKGGGALWILSLYQGGTRLAFEDNQSTFGHSEWSADGKWIYIQKDEELFRVSSFSPEAERIAPGTAPSVSPDGKYLAAVYKENVSLWDQNGKLVAELGKGSNPQWINPSWLMYWDPVSGSPQAVKIDGESRALQPIRLPSSLSGEALIIKQAAKSTAVVVLATENGKTKLNVAQIRAK